MSSAAHIISHPQHTASDELLVRGGDLIHAGRYDEAAHLLHQLVARNPNDANGWMKLGVACEKLGKFNEAVIALENAIKLVPTFLNAMVKLAEIHERTGQHQQAESLLARAIALKPDNAVLHYRYAHCATQLEHYEQAERAARTAMQMDPTNYIIPLALAGIYAYTNRHNEAIGLYMRTLAGNPQHQQALYGIGVSYMYSKQYSQAITALASVLLMYPHHTSALCYYLHCLRAAGEHDRANKLDDSSVLIEQVDINKLLPVDDISHFRQTLHNELEHHPTKQWEKASTATVNGYHTGSLLQADSDTIATLSDAIRRAIDAYCTRLRNALPGDHPLIRSMPAAYDLNMWAVIMQEGSYQHAHNHPSGWLSGCYYLTVPPEIASDASNEGHSGWIEFGEPGYDIAYDYKPAITAMKPAEGIAVLFPSYMFHKTIPFQATSPRISIAFDVIARAQR